MHVLRTVSEIFRVKMAWPWNLVRVHSRSLEMAPFDRSHDELLLAFYGPILYVVFPR